VGNIAILEVMVEARHVGVMPALKTPRRGPDARLVAAGCGWTVNEYTCHAGPQDQPFEEWHAGISIAAVVAGTFYYRTDTGRALMHPGSFLLGNEGACFECSHDHGTGDRCVSFHFAPAFFGEIAATAANSSRYRFTTPILPAQPETMTAVVGLEAIGQGNVPLGIEEAVVSLATTVLSAVSGHMVTPARVSSRDERRVTDVVRYMQERANERHTLSQLAVAAGLSRFHFLRVFRQTIGTSPYQYLLTLRMHRAAARLIESLDTVSSIAFDAGFADLSTFNRRFRRVFGMSPLAYRGATGAIMRPRQTDGDSTP
jgi:AraC family transcriptional regulator